MRIHRLPAYVSEPLFLFRDDKPLKAHPAYRAAKAGDARSAVDLVEGLAGPLITQTAKQFGPNAIYVAPHAQEATGDNAIPQVLVEAIADLAGGQADRDIVQTSRVFHTGADPMERLNNRAEFDGDVRPGDRYVLVDDVATMGGTLAELSHYIQAMGGLVAGVAVLVNAARAGRLIQNSLRNSKGGMAMQSEKTSESNPPPSPPRKPATSSDSARLTKSEIEALRQSKKRIGAYAHEALREWVEELREKG